jgi:SNF2 family DNA or RNA helicase
MSEQSIRTHFDLSQKELDKLKDEIRNIHEQNQLQSLADSTLITPTQIRERRISCLQKAIKDGKLTGKVSQKWQDKTTQDCLHWLLRNVQYQRTRRDRSTSAMPKSLQPSLAVSSSLKPENPQTKSLESSLALLSPLKPEKSQIKSQMMSVSSQSLLGLSSSQQPPETQRDSTHSTTDTPSPIPSRPISSHEHGTKRSYWLTKNNSQPRSPAAAELYRVFLVTNNTVTQNTWPVMVGNLPSHGIDGSLSEIDWSEWIRQLTNYCGFNPDTQKIQTPDGLFIITNYSIWCTVVLMCLEDLAPSGGKDVTGSLQVYFAIVENTLEIERGNVLIDLENPTTKLTSVSEPDISDDSSTNIRPPKRLRSAVTDEDQISNPPADDTPIITTPKSRRSPIKWDTSPTDTQTPKQLPSAVVEKDPTSDLSGDTIDKMQDDVSDNINPESYVDQTPKQLPSAVAEKDPTSDVSGDPTDKMQDDVSDNINPESYVDQIIIRDTIATKEDLEHEALNPTNAIHVATKKCEQFSDERWKHFQIFFMLPKEGNDGTDPDRPITFRGLSRHPYPHQLYAAFIIVIKERGPSRGGYLGDEMGLGKTTVAIMVWVLNAWLVENHRHVEHARSHPESSHLHLPENAPEAAACPSQYLWPFLCSCVNSPFSAKDLEPREGATLVVSPKSLLLTWAKEWSEIIPNGQDKDKRNFMNFRLFIGHGDIKHRVLEKIGHPSIKLIADQKDKLKAEEDLTSGQNDHRYIVVTTPLSFETRVLPYTDRFDTGRHRNFYSDAGILARLKWGSIIRDEFHGEKGQSSTTVRLFRKLICRQEGSFLPTWLLSGTMFEKGPIDLQHWMHVLETDTWAEHPTLKHAIEKPYKALSTRVQQLLNKPPPLLQPEKEEMKQLAAKFSLILEELAISRSAKSTWFGKPVIKLPPHEHHDIVCNISDKYLADFKELEQAAILKTKRTYWKNLETWNRNKSEPMPEMSMDGFLKQSRIIRIASIFPAILQLVKETGIQLTDDEFKQHKWHTETNPAPYFLILDKLVQSSSKCKVLEDILQEMAKSCDFAGRPEKLVIISQSPVVVRMMFKVSAPQP